MAVGLGVYPDIEAIDDLVGIERVVEPRSALRRLYDRLYGDYRSVYTALAPVFRSLGQDSR